MLPPNLFLLFPASTPTWIYGLDVFNKYASNQLKVCVTATITLKLPSEVWRRYIHTVHTIRSSIYYYPVLCALDPLLFSPALSLSASLLLGGGKDGQALMAWLETQGCGFLDFGSLSSVDSTLTAKDVATNVEMLLAIEEDSDAADRVWGGRGVVDVAELVVG